MMITFDEGRVHELSVDLDPTAQERAIKRPVVVPEKSSYLIRHLSVKCVYFSNIHSYRMHVCIYVCIYVLDIYICMEACMYVCMYVCMYGYMN